MSDVQPLTAQQAEWLELYRRDARFSGFDITCTDCGQRDRCCRDKPRRSLLRRLLRKDDRCPA